MLVLVRAVCENRPFFFTFVFIGNCLSLFGFILYSKLLIKQFMKITLLMLAFVACSCSTVRYFNDSLDKQIPASQLKSDVDYARNKLEKLHPNLYWYISKKDLNQKFDNLKAAITKPMTNKEFYLKISPIVASVHEGHAIVYPPTKMLKWKENEAKNKYGATPLSKFEFETFNNKLYILKNNSLDSTLKAGTEIIKVNNKPPADYIEKYRNNFASDGFNKTYIDNRLSKGFSTFFYFENDITDSVQCTIRYHDTTRNVSLRRISPSKSIRKNAPSKISPLDKEKMRKEAVKNKYLGYDKSSKKYSKNLNFYEADSSIAVMKLNNFSKGQSKKFFHNSFNMLAKLKTKTLIIDLRDNPGGKINEISDLYSYLVDSNFVFLDKSIVVSKTSVLHVGYFSGIPWGVKITRAAFYPLLVAIMTVPFFKIRKDKEGRYIYHNSQNKAQRPKPNNFKGNVYVLINGGSFSASCILSSNLKGAKKATFVGSETGGAYNGTVAGMIPVFTLPHSKLRLRFGLVVIQPPYKTNIEGRGIFPDVEITPTLEDRLKNVDPELEWALQSARTKINQ